MAQANSAKREPSMEEILASIRRIIEDNDTGSLPSVDFEEMCPEPEDDRGDRNIIEVEALRAEFQPAKAAPVDAKPVEVAPVAVKHETARRDGSSSAFWPSLETKKPAALEKLAFTPTVKTGEASLTSTASWAPQVSVTPVEQVVSEEHVALKPAIMSELAGRQVSAAFGELNDAYAARSCKSFDDIGIEMMRPMLQDWLDNNLPKLVERLVREEIERIAHGA